MNLAYRKFVCTIFGASMRRGDWQTAWAFHNT